MYMNNVLVNHTKMGVGLYLYYIPGIGSLSL